MFQALKRFVIWLNTDDDVPNHSDKVENSAVKAPEGFTLAYTKVDIENDEIIQDKLRVLGRSGLALPYEVWQEFVVDTVVNFSLWCQDLPASQSYHHAGKRGLLLHSLDVAIYAMRIRRNYILPPNTPPEDVIHREIVWVYGVFLCALLHDAGKIHDFEIELYQEGGEPVRWTPALGPITGAYRCRYYKHRQYSTHQHTSVMLLNQLLSADPMLAITHDHALFHAMTEYLSGHASPDNVIEHIVVQADAASVAQDLGADKDGINLAAEKARHAPASLAGQLRLTLVHLIESGDIPLNKKGAEGFVDGESLFLMSKPIADRLRTSLIERGITSAPSDNSRLFNELQQHNLIRPNDQDMAIWKCDVRLTEHDWQQTFTFVCVHWPSLVPEAELESIIGSIMPVIEESEGVEVVSPQTAEPSAIDLPEGVSHANDNEVIEPSEQPSIPYQEATVSDDLMQFFPGLSANPEPQEIESTPVHHESEPEVTNVEPVQYTVKVETEEALQSVESAVQETLPDNHILLRKIDLREIKGEALGRGFCEWVDAVLKGGVHPVNCKNAMFHRVEQGMLVVSPGAFRTFITERCQYGKPNSYIHIQQGLQPLGQHIVNAQGRNVHKAHIKESDRSLNGFLFEMKPEWSERYAVNPHVMLEEGE